MFILKITIKNYRLFNDFTIDEFNIPHKINQWVLKYNSLLLYFSLPLFHAIIYILRSIGNEEDKDIIRYINVYYTYSINDVICV